MISFITEQVQNPWSNYDIEQYEKNGSQRDTVHYNRSLNSRLILSEKNIFQCSIRVNDNKYKNFYILAATRSVFFLIIYVPQLDILKSLSDNNIVRECVKKSSVLNNFINHSSQHLDMDKDISYCDGNTAFIKVNAPIGEFLFPRRGYIINEEIIQKYNLLNKIYYNAQIEFENIGNYLELYNKKIGEQLAKREQMVKKMLIKKGVRVGISLALTCATGFYMDFDSVFGIDDLDDASDLMDLADTTDFVEMTDIADWDTTSDGLTGDFLDYSSDIAYNGEGDYNISFQGSDKSVSVHLEGNQSITETVTAKKVAGTSDKWDIYKGNKKITTLKGINSGKFYLPGFGTAIID